VDEKSAVLIAAALALLWLSPAFRWRAKVAAWVIAFVAVVAIVIAPGVLGGSAT
jgi:hypothetical protein